MVDSILASCDGRSFETAYVVIDLGEEYASLRAPGIRPDRQLFVEYRGHRYDVFDFQDPKAGKAARIYFDIDLPQGWLRRSWNS